MNSLFATLPEQLSPRRAWMQQHGVLTHWFRHAEPGQRCMAIIPLPEDQGLNVAECMARHCRIYDEGGLIGYGDTLEDSLLDLAAKKGIPDWKGALA